MGLKAIDLNPIELFAAQYLSHWLTKVVPDFHRDWYRGFADESLKRLVIESTRGGAKSTVCKIACIYWICEGKEKEYQLITQSGGATGLSTKWMRDIRTELETNQQLILDYRIQKGETWGNEHIQVKRADGNTIDFYCRGKHAAIRGFRGNLIIDDPQDSDDCKSETVLSRDEDWFFSDVLPVMLKEHRIILIGTPISPLSLISKVKQLKNWIVMSYPIEQPVGSGKSRWPEQYTDDYLSSQKSDMGIDRYRAEYLCQPMVSGNPVFKQEWIQGYDPTSLTFEKLKSGGLYIITGFDGAESKSDSADYTAIITIGVTYDKIPNIYVLDVRYDHWSTKEGAEQLFVVYDKFKQHKSVVESRCKPPNKDAIIEEIEEREHTYRTFVNLYQVKPDKDKVRRAHNVQGLFQDGRVFFDLEDKHQQALIDELIMFTGDGRFHDDKVDALVYAMNESKGWMETKETGGAKIVRHKTKITRPTGMPV